MTKRTGQNAVIADEQIIQQFISKVGNVPLFMKSDDNMKAVWKDKLICEYPILLKRPPDKPIPHCNECRHLKKQKFFKTTLLDRRRII